MTTNDKIDVVYVKASANPFAQFTAEPRNTGARRRPRLAPSVSAVQRCLSGWATAWCWRVKAAARPCHPAPGSGPSHPEAPCPAEPAAPWPHPAAERAGWGARRPRPWGRLGSCLCSVTKRAKASSQSETCRGYRGSCRCPPSSWRKCLRAWTGRATASSPLQSSTPVLVSCTVQGAVLLAIGLRQVEEGVSLCSLRVIRGALPSKTNQVQLLLRLLDASDESEACCHAFGCEGEKKCFFLTFGSFAVVP